MFFEFEADFVDSLRCIPLLVRYKLDTCGVKLKLSHWHQLSLQQRQHLSQAPCSTPEEVLQYRTQLQEWIIALTGAPAGELEVSSAPAWLDETAIPPALLVWQEQMGLAPLTLPQWQSLSPLQRFALMKLSQPGHENRNFLPALQEFGLT